MNDEHPSVRKQSLDERFANDPVMRERMHQIADMRDQLIANGCSLDEVEERVVEQIRLLGQELLGTMAQTKADQLNRQARREHPAAVRDIKKKVNWFTTLGTITVEEQVLRLGRRGIRWRPFCEALGIGHRDYSRKLQRAMTDFGAEESFKRAAQRLQEHYGITVNSEAIRLQSLRHGKAIAAIEPPGQVAAKEMITEMDGSLIPVVQPAKSGDKRKGKTLVWREVRVCCARAEGKDSRLYGATLGSMESCSLLWAQTARYAGLRPHTYVHAVGDGAPWILEKFKENFEPQGQYLLDFYHVSEYLAQAARVIVGEKKALGWVRRQQGRLLNNQLSKVLRSLSTHLEPPSQQETPVRDAYRYLDQRRAHLDYQGARQRKLPIGSGEIESAHRHLIQKRLKLSGSWWKETNAETLITLRTARANLCWDRYWNKN